MAKHIAMRWAAIFVFGVTLGTVLGACGSDDGNKMCGEFCNDDDECSDGYACIYGLVNNTKPNTVCMPSGCKGCSKCVFKQTSSDTCEYVSCGD